MTRYASPIIFQNARGNNYDYKVIAADLANHQLVIFTHDDADQWHKTSAFPLPSGAPGALVGFQNHASEYDLYEIFFHLDGAYRHLTYNATGDQWVFGPVITESLDFGGGLAAFQNTSPGNANFEVFLQERDAIRHWFCDPKGDGWIQGKRFGRLSRGLRAAFQNHSPNNLNYELIVSMGDELQHYWYGHLGDAQWHVGQTVRGTPGLPMLPAAGFQNISEANYNYEIFCFNGRELRHFWYNHGGDGQWHPEQTIATFEGYNDFDPSIGACQNHAPGNRHYELVVAEGDHLQHYWFGHDEDRQWHKGKAFGGTDTVTAVKTAPRLALRTTSGPSVPIGQGYSITVAVADWDGDLTYVELNWNDGTAVERKAVSGGAAFATFSRSYSAARTINWSSRAYDSTGGASNEVSGTFTVTDRNHAPTLEITTTSGPSVPTGEIYSITVTVADTGNDLKYVELNWNDGTAVERRGVSGGRAVATFSRSYSTARTINWSAKAYDSAGSASNQVSGSFNVTVLVTHAPTLTLTSTSGTSVPTRKPYSITLRAADVDGNLSHVDLSWNDGTVAEYGKASGSEASVTFSRAYGSPRTISWSATAYDSGGLASNPVFGTFNVR